jgi:hypothetical protein
VDAYRLQDVKVKQPEKFKLRSGNKSKCSPSMKADLSKIETLSSSDVDPKKSSAFSPTTTST